MSLSTARASRRKNLMAATAALAVLGSTGASPAPSYASAVGDDFNAPTFITGVRGGISLSNVGATGEPGEPSHSTSLSGVKDLPDHSIWFRWKSPITGRAVFRTEGSTFDTVMAAYTGTSLSGLTKVATNDDTTFINTAGAREELQSQIGFKAVKDTTYNIAVDSFTGTKPPDQVTTGKVKLTWDTNDNVANARPLPTSTSQTLTMVGNNTGATHQVGEPTHAHLSDGAGSIWYSFTAPQTGFIQFNSAGSEIDAVLAAYKGSLATGLTQIAQSDPTRGADTMALALKAGQVVKIAIDGENPLFDEGTVLLSYGYGAFPT